MTLAGIDVSNYQGPAFDWPSWRGKIQFAGVKVSEGTTFADPDARRNIAGARSVGAAVMGYHFLHADASGAAQAEWFLKCAHAAGLKPGDLIAVDVEDDGLDGYGPATMNEAAAVFAAELRKHFPGFWPVVYTEMSLAGSLTSLGSCPLWLANPGGEKLTSIGPWKVISFEQVSERGTDLDVFYGDAAQLAALAFSR